MSKDNNNDQFSRGSQVVDLKRAQGSSSRINNMAELGRMSVEEMAARKIVHPGMQNKQVLNTFREIRTQILQRA